MHVNCFDRTKSRVSHRGAIPLLIYSLFHYWSVEIELGGECADEIAPCSHINTHQPIHFPHACVKHLMFLLFSTGHEGNGFFTHIPFSQPAARCHGNRKPVERVNCLSPVLGRKVFIWWCLLPVLVHCQETTCLFVHVLSVCIYIYAMMFVLPFLLVYFVHICGTKKRLTWCRASIWVRMNESKNYWMPLSPWLQQEVQCIFKQTNSS